MTELRSTSNIEFVRHDKLHHASLIVVNLLYRNMHEHSDFEMNYVLDGEAKIRHRDEEFVVSQGDFFITNPYEPHEILATGATHVQLLCLQLSKHFCEEYSVLLKSVLFKHASLAQYLSHEDYVSLLKYYFSFCETYWSEGEGYQLDCVARLCMLMSFLLKKVSHTVIDEKTFDLRRAKHSRARRLREYIDKHYKEKISLDTLAEAENLSRTYVSHFFHDNLNVTFQEYLNHVRLNNAIRLMLDTDMGITDVCMESGFSDNKYLNQMLRKEFGCNASSFRDQYRDSDIVVRTASSEKTCSQRILGPADSFDILKKHRELYTR